jgi:hypothetical protein
MEEKRVPCTYQINDIKSQGRCTLKCKYGHLHHCNGEAREPECSMNALGAWNLLFNIRNKRNEIKKELVRRKIDWYA